MKPMRLKTILKWNSILENMKISEAQNEADKWIKEIGGGYFSPLTNMALLTEEVGELARIISRTYGEQIAKKGDLNHSLAEELADVLWVTVCLANQTGIDLTEAFREGLRKRYSRDRHRFDSNPDPSL